MSYVIGSKFALQVWIVKTEVELRLLVQLTNLRRRLPDTGDVAVHAAGVQRPS